MRYSNDDERSLFPDAEAARVDFTDAVCESEQIAANNRGVSQWRPVRFADNAVFLNGQPVVVLPLSRKRSTVRRNRVNRHLRQPTGLWNRYQ